MSSLRVTLLSLLLATGLARANVARLKAEAEQKAHAEASELLRTLCPEQCRVLTVEAKVEEETITVAAPGFDSPTGGTRLPTLRSLNVQLLADSQLPSAFRTRLKPLVLQKLQPLAPTVNVETQLVAFPPKNPQHLELPERAPLPPPAPEPAPTPVEAPKEEKPVMPQQASSLDYLLSATLVAVVLLLVFAVVALGVLLYLALRPKPPAAVQPNPSLEPQPFASAEGFEPLAAAELRPAGPEFPPSRRRKLERALREERVVRNAVVRQALSQGEVKAVAAWTRELGEFLLDDLRGDPALQQSLQALTAELSRPPESDPAERAAMFFELEGRVMGARLAQAEDSADAAFSFLQGVLPERFSAAVRDLPPGALDVALRFAPPPLRAAALAELGAPQRAELALSLARRPDLSTSYALAVADDLRSRVLDTAGSPAQADRMLGEVLESLPMEEQDRLVERLQREGNGRVARALVTESTLGGTPVEILSAALLGLPPARLVSYLGGAEGGLRDRLLSACPPRLKNELKEELGLKGQSSRDEFFAARRELLASLKDEFNRRGLTAGDLRSGPETGGRPG